MTGINAYSLAALACVALVAGCTTPESAFEEARRLDSVAAYEKFLDQHPSGALAGKARDRIDEIEFEAAREADTLGALEAFLREHPRATQADEASSRIVALRFDQACADGTERAFREFLARLPPAGGNDFADRAQERIEGLRFATARASASIAAYTAFLEEYPSGVHSTEARSLRDALIEAEFGEARAADTVAAYRDFLRIESRGARAALALARLEELELQSARSSSDIEALRAFLREFPASRHRGEIALKLAAAVDTDESYIEFLLDHSGAPEAEQAVARLKDYEYRDSGCLIRWERLGSAYGGSLANQDEFCDGVDLAGFRLVRGPRPSEDYTGRCMVVGSIRFYRPNGGSLTFPGWVEFGGNYCTGRATVVAEGLSFDRSSRVLLKK